VSDERGARATLLAGHRARGKASSAGQEGGGTEREVDGRLLRRGGGGLAAAGRAPHLDGARAKAAPATLMRTDGGAALPLAAVGRRRRRDAEEGAELHGRFHFAPA
jgi:hypothetical protein